MSLLRARWPRRRTVVILALGLFIAGLGLSLWLLGAPPPRRIVLATGDPAGGFAALGKEYKARLDRMGLRVELVETAGSLDNLQRLHRGEVDVAFVQAGLAQQLDSSEGLCGLAAVGSEPLWVFSRSLPPAASLRDLKGHAIVLGPPVSGSDALGRLLLREHGVTPANATFLNLSMGQTRQALRDGKADTVLMVCACNAPIVEELIHDAEIRLVSLSGQAGIARRFPYLRPVVLPEGVLDLEDDLPAEDKHLLAPTTSLVAREDLHPRAVEQLLMAAQAVHAPGGLLEEPGRFPSLEGMDLPPHIAAEKFLKSGESLVSRLLPYWSVRLVWQAQLLVLPLLALLVPFWKTLPMLYSIRVNNILKRHYTALREVESQIDHCNDPVQLRQALAKVDGLRTDLETLSRKLPAHLQRDVYHWRQHVALVRTEGHARLRRLEDPAG
jgi:TRAP transporter TAXI family solute receptor